MPDEPGLPPDLEARVNELLGPFYDRAGNPIGWNEYARKKLGPDRDDRVGLDTIGNHTISTVWLGSPEGKDWGHGERPLIFETLITGPEGSRVWARYPTEAEAEDGHRQAIWMVTPNQHTETHDHPLK